MSGRGVPAETGRVAIVVLGPHRSGTSALAGALAAAGVPFGDDLLPADSEVNPRGFWEHAELVAINEAVLAALGREWHDVRPMPDGWWSRPALAPLAVRATRFLRETFAPHTLCGLKDPRLCRLLPFWLPCFAAAGWEPRFVGVVRHPEAVARSLERVHRLVPATGHLLWLEHVVEAEAATRGRPRAFCLLRRVVEDPQAALAGVAERLGVTWPESLDGRSAGIERGLLHFDTHPAAAGALPFALARRWFDAFVAAQEAAGPDGDGAPPPDLCDALGAEYRTALELLDPVAEQLAEARTAAAGQAARADDAEGRAIESGAWAERAEGALAQATADADRMRAVAEAAAGEARESTRVAQAEAARAVRAEAAAAESAARVAALEGAERELEQLRDSRGVRVVQRLARWKRGLGALVRPVRRRWKLVRRAWQNGRARLVNHPLPLKPLLPGAHRRTDRPNADEAIRVLPALTVDEATHDAIYAHPNTTLGFRLPLPARAGLRGWIAVHPEMVLRNRDGVEFAVQVEADGATHTAWSTRLEPARRRAHRGWRPIRVDLSRWAGRTVTVELVTRIPDGGTGTGAWALWGDPQVVEELGTLRTLGRLWSAFRVRGWRGTLGSIWRILRGRSSRLPESRLYQLWLLQHGLTRGERRRVETALEACEHRPRISMVVPVYNTRSDWLRRCVESVRAQIYPNWELCLYDDGSPEPRVAEEVRRYAAGDERIRAECATANRGIAAASNGALALATGEFVALLDHDDELTPDALARLVVALNDAPDGDVFYTDEDKLEPDGSRSTPFFKPDWSPEYFLASMYTCHLTMYRRTLLDAVGGFREGFDGSQDYDLMLRASEQARRIVHVPHICYHWRKVPGSTAASEHAKSTAGATRRALAEHLERRGIPGTVEATEMPGVHRVRPAVQGAPRVSIVIPTRDRLSLLARCVASIEQLTTWEAWDLCIVDNGSVEPETLAYLDASPHQVVRRDESFNFSRLVNAGVAATAGEFVLLLNNDIEVITPGWLEAMLEMMQFPEVGVVGAKLYYPDERIQHAGVITGVGGVAGHAHRFAPRESYGYFGSLICTRNFSAVTAACLLARRSVYESVGGFDPQLAVAFNDIDFCLRVRDAGHRIVWTPHAELYHYESASRGHAMDPAEIQLMQSRWGDRLRRDPYYHPALTLEREDYTLAF